MKLRYLAALLLSAGALSPQAVLAAQADVKAAGLADCCTAGDKDFPQ